MSKHSVEKIYNIAERTGINKVAVLTNHLKFVGTLCQEDDSIDDESILTLTDTKMWRIEDVCTCTEPECKCNEANFCALERVHFNMSKVVAFSLMKE